MPEIESPPANRTAIAMGAQRPKSPYENPLPRRETRLVSGFGPQVKSTMQSFPSPSFTKGSRDVEGEKVSNNHNHDIGIRDSTPDRRTYPSPSTHRCTYPRSTPR